MPIRRTANCDNCHEVTATAQPSHASVFYTNPSREACGSCHDDVTGPPERTTPAGSRTRRRLRFVPLPREAEFDASIKGAHIIRKIKTAKGLTATS